MDEKRLRALSNDGRFRDRVGIDDSRIYPLFGIGKLVAQNAQRPVLAEKDGQKLVKAMENLARLNAKHEKEADWSHATENNQAPADSAASAQELPSRGKPS